MNPKILAGHFVLTSNLSKIDKLKTLEYIERASYDEIIDVLNEFDFVDDVLGSKSLARGVIKIGILSAITIASRIISERKKAKKFCELKGLKDVSFKICKYKYYIDISTKAIRDYNNSIRYCKKDSNPEKCRYKIKKLISDESRKLEKYKYKLKTSQY